MPQLKINTKVHIQHNAQNLQIQYGVGGEKQNKFTALYDLYLKYPNTSSYFMKIHLIKRLK